MKKTQTIEMDIRGQICPSCLLLTLKEVNNHAAALRRGETQIMVYTDERQAVNTIPDAVDKMGYAAEVEQHESGYCIRIRHQGTT